MKIIFTGGGTAGHVNPNLVLIDVLKRQGHTLLYIGSYDGVEAAMVRATAVPFVGISTGKLRRYRHWKNWIDPFKVLWGLCQAYWKIRRFKPDLVFSKGGYVALPVVIAAWLNGVRVIAHESDLTPGLANRLSLPFVDSLCVTFDGTQISGQHQHKVRVTGTPLREALLKGSAEQGRALCGFDASRPCLLVMGGSQGSQKMNEVVRAALTRLTEHYQIIHLCGKGQIDLNLQHTPHYYQMEYANQELPDILAASDGVISRAGANTVYELLALKKPHVLIPLSTKASRGDQIHNATYCEQKGTSTVLKQEDLNPETLLHAIQTMMSKRAEHIEAMAALKIQSATETIIRIIITPP